MLHIFFLLLFGGSNLSHVLVHGLQVQKLDPTTISPIISQPIVPENADSTAAPTLEDTTNPSLVPKATPTPTGASMILPICGGNKPVEKFSADSASMSRFAKQDKPVSRMRYQPSHIGVLPPVGGIAQLVLTENNTIPTAQPGAGPADETTSSYSNDSPVYCSIRLESCPSCLIELQFEPPHRYLSEFDIESVSKCEETSLLDNSCFDVEIIEERAEQSISFLSSLAGEPDVYSRTSIWSDPSRKKLISTANSVLIVVALKNIHQHPKLERYIADFFPISAVVRDNTVVRYGQPSKSIFLANETSIGFVESPRYPDAYPRSVVRNYTLINTNKAGFVRLTFDDFHMHFQSEVVVSDGEGQLFSTKLEYRRPPALVSRSNSITVVFKSNDYTQSIGFRARYEFVNNLHWPDKPSSKNCDDYLENYGGRISLDSQKTLVSQYIDCIWLIGRFPALTRTFDRIYLKIQEFQIKGAGLRLEVRKGPSSSAERVLLLFDEQSPVQLERKQPLDGLLTEDTAQPAFYVRLRGFLGTNKGLSIVYTQFYRWATALCPGGDGEYHCSNSRCIKATLQCDGFDHCGDATDESSCNRNLDANHENQHVDIAGALTLVIGAVGIVVLLLTIVAIMSKLYRHRLGNNRRAAMSATFTGAGNAAMAHEAYCNELAPSIQTIGDRRFYVLPDAALTSIIEAPPTYQDALKHPRLSSGRSRSAMSYAYANEGFRRSRDLTAPVEERPAPPRRRESTASRPKLTVSVDTPPPLPTSPIPDSPRSSSSASTSFPSTSSTPNPPIGDDRPSSSRSHVHSTASSLRRSRSSEGSSPNNVHDESWV